MQAVPLLKELYARYKDQGLVLIGVHSTTGAAAMPAFAKARGITFPLAADTDEKTANAYILENTYPAYYLIDRSGKLRVADIVKSDLERAIKMLLAEAAPEHPDEVEEKGAGIEEKEERGKKDAERVLQESLSTASKNDRRVLVHLRAPG